MSGAGGGADRRTSTRVDTYQHVVFSDHRATGPLRTGTAVDRSTGGVRIVTAFPEPVGSTIQIELQHASGAGVTLLEGRVMHVGQTESGLYAMGIRLASRALRPPAPTRVAGGATAGRSRTAAARLDVTVGTPGDSVGGAAAMMNEEVVTFRRVSDRNRAGSWAALLAILALLLILGWLIMVALKEQQRRASRPDDPATPSEATRTIEQDEIDVASKRQNATLGGSQAAESVSWPERREVSDDFSASFASVRGSVDGIAAVAPALERAALELEGIRNRVPTQPPMSVDQFAGQLEYAQRAYERGERGLAMAVTRRALLKGAGIPAAWRNVAVDLLAAFERGTQGRGQSGLSGTIALDPVKTASAPSHGSGVHIEVDTGDHVLRVFRDNALLVEFPVGLGRDGATPRGTFRIANKISNPAWYPEDGRIVPAGDPGNPIGPQWMGLANGGAPKGIGIHPTQQADSIGRDASEGCVRMRPADSEALYRLAPIGSPVVIHD